MSVDLTDLLEAEALSLTDRINEMSEEAAAAKHRNDMLRANLEAQNETLAAELELARATLELAGKENNALKNQLEQSVQRLQNTQIDWKAALAKQLELGVALREAQGLAERRLQDLEMSDRMAQNVCAEIKKIGEAAEKAEKQWALTAAAEAKGVGELQLRIVEHATTILRQERKLLSIMRLVVGVRGNKMPQAKLAILRHLLATFQPRPQKKQKKASKTTGSSQATYGARRV